MFNVVGTYIDKSVVYGGLGYWGNGSGPYRMANSIAVSTNVGGFNLSADAQMPSGGDDIDIATVGTNLSVGGVSVGIAHADHADGKNMTGIGASISLAGVGLSGGWTDVDTAGSGFGVNAKLAGITLAYDESDAAADATIYGNYAIGLGGGAKVIVEIANDGTNTKGAGILRMDF